MKPLYWKFFLIVGTMIVGASLVVPKALRKNAAQTLNISQTLFVADQSQNTSLDTYFGQSENDIIIDGKVKSYLTDYTVNISKFNFETVISIILNVNAPTHSLNAGTRPTKSRVID